MNDLLLYQPDNESNEDAVKKVKLSLQLPQTELGLDPENSKVGGVLECTIRSSDRTIRSLKSECVVFAVSSSLISVDTLITTKKNEEELRLESGSTIYVSITFDNPRKLKRDVDKSRLSVDIYQGYGLDQYFKSSYLLVEDVKILPPLEG